MANRAKCWVSALLCCVSLAQAASDQGPETYKLLTGKQDGVYYEMGLVLSKVLSDEIDVQVEETRGSLDNLQCLRTGKKRLALVQEDVLENLAKAEQPNPWCTLLALTLEPVHIVVPKSSGEISSVRDLQNRDLAVGHEGGGTYFAATQILKALHVKPERAKTVASHTSTMKLIESRDVSAGFFITSPPSRQVASLLASPRFRLLPFTEEEQERVLRDFPVYRKARIGSLSYKQQKSVVETVGVATVLVCHQKLSRGTADAIVTEILNDVMSRRSILREANNTITLNSLLGLTREMTNRAAVAQHPGAASAIEEVPFWRYERSPIRVIYTIGWFASLVVMLVSLSDSLRGKSIQLLRLGKIRIPREWLFGGWWVIPEVASAVVFIWLTATFAMHFLEHGKNQEFDNLVSSSLSTLVYLFSGLEETRPKTGLGWFCAALVLVAALGVHAYITGTWASQRLMGGMFRMKQNTAKGGFLVVGWNARSRRIVQDLLSLMDQEHRGETVTVLDEKLVDQSQRTPGVAFEVGQPHDGEVLARVGAHQARAVLIVSYYKDISNLARGDAEKGDPDNEAILTILALKKLCDEQDVPPGQRPPICANILDQRKVKLVEEAGASVVVCHEDYGLRLLAQSAVHGRACAEVYKQLLTSAEGTCEVYFLSPANRHAGNVPPEVWRHSVQSQPFREVAKNLQRCDSGKPLILIGLERSGRIVLNPDGKQKDGACMVREDDRLVVIAYNRPRPADFKKLVPAASAA